MVDFLEALWDVVTNDTAFAAAARFAAVLSFAAVGEWIAERAGTLNISVEGMLLAGAFGAAVGLDLTGSMWLGLAFGAIAGAVVASPQAEISHRLPADQFVVGLTLNILVLGVAGFLAADLDLTTHRADAVEIPVLVKLPLVGDALFGQPWPFYLLYPLLLAAWYVVYRTRWGLEIRAVGEDPQAADVSGVHVNLRRRQAIYVAGLTSGLGGAYLVLGQVGRFDDGMVGGRGFIAIAAVIFGGWTLRGSIAGCVLFGTILSFRLSLPQLGYDSLNTEMLQAAPYVVTIAVMAIFARRVRPPAALAQPFIRGLK
jgi:general nucleoside transport system permease protein